MRRQISDLVKLLRGDDVGGALFECLRCGSHGPHPTPSAATCSVRDLNQNAAGASARANAFGRAAVRADDGCADCSLRKLLLAINFRNDLPPKLVRYGSPERRHSAGAFLCSHGVIFETANGCGRAAIRSASHALISERDQAFLPLGASGSPILKLRGNFPSRSSRQRVEA